MASIAVGTATGSGSLVTRLSVASPAPRDAWREVAASDPDALVTQSPEWLDAVCADRGYEDASRLYLTPEGKRLVLPMVRRRGLWPSPIAPLASMPHAWGMGGVLADSPVEQRDIAAIAADLRSGPAVRSAIRPNPLHHELWAGLSRPGTSVIPRLAHVVDLAGGSAEVWQRMSKKARSGVRKAQRAGLEIECDTTGRLVGVFHDLLELSVERWARAQNEPLALARWRAGRRDPPAKLERMAAALGESMRVWVAWKDGVAAAGMIVLVGSNASDTRGAMNKEIAAPTGANDLLQWLAIEDACNAGCASYHLGESGASRSLAHFKEKFGARPVPYAEYRLERLPLTSAGAVSRGLVKRALRFRDA